MALYTHWTERLSKRNAANPTQEQPRSKKAVAQYYPLKALRKKKKKSGVIHSWPAGLLVLLYGQECPKANDKSERINTDI